jgi:arylsulfatase A-like enzyme
MTQKRSLSNIIFVLIDSLRHDVLETGLTGNSRMPHLEKLAKDGFLFDQTISHGTSTPIAVPPLLSSTYTSMYGGPGILSMHRPTIWEILNSHGYTSAAFFTNPIISSHRGWNRGFDYSEDCLPDSVYKRSYFVRAANQVTKRFGRPVFYPRFLPAEYAVPRAIKWLTRAREPFFLFLHLMDVHFPYRAESFSWTGHQRVEDEVIRRKMVESFEPLNTLEMRAIKERYDAALAYTDEYVGRLLHELHHRHLLEQSMVVVASDHGEMFGEHNSWYHHYKFYDELIRVPLLIKLPSSVVAPSGKFLTHQIRLLDVVPTILEVCEIPPSKIGFSPLGSSLLAQMTGKESFDERLAIIESWRNQSICLRWQGWKYMAGPDWHIGDNPPDSIRDKQSRLFNLKADPGETMDRLADYPELAAVLKSHIDRHLEMIEPHRGMWEEKIESDDRMVERLRALGYVEQQPSRERRLQ